MFVLITAVCVIKPRKFSTYSQYICIYTVWYIYIYLCIYIFIIILFWHEAWTKRGPPSMEPTVAILFPSSHFWVDEMFRRFFRVFFRGGLRYFLAKVTQLRALNESVLEFFCMWWKMKLNLAHVCFPQSQGMHLLSEQGCYTCVFQRTPFFFSEKLVVFLGRVWW